MIRALLLLGYLWSVCPPVMSIADDLIDSSLWTTPPGPALPSVAGIPYADALMIVERHRKELERFPEVRGIELTAEGIVVYTDFPEALPREIEGIPVTSRPLTSVSPLPPSGDTGGEASPSAPHSEEPSPSSVSTVQAFPPVAGIPYTEAVAIADRHREELLRQPGVYIIAVGDGGLILGVYVYSKDRTVPSDGLQKLTANLPTTIEGLPVKIKPLPVLPPPNGVIILRPGGLQEQAAACPSGFTEAPTFGWRFCINPEQPEPIPLLMEPSIAGISYSKAAAILERHREELLKLPGVQGVGLGAEGISVWTDNPAILPSQLEGLPVKVRLSQGSARAR